MQIIQERNPWEPFAQGFSQGLQNLAQGVAQGQQKKAFKEALIKSNKYTPEEANLIVNSPEKLQKHFIAMGTASKNQAEYDSILNPQATVEPTQQTYTSTIVPQLGEQVSTPKQESNLNTTLQGLLQKQTQEVSNKLLNNQWQPSLSPRMQALNMLGGGGFNQMNQPSIMNQEEVVQPQQQPQVQTQPVQKPAPERIIDPVQALDEKADRYRRAARLATSKGDKLAADQFNADADSLERKAREERSYQSADEKEAYKLITPIFKEAEAAKDSMRITGEQRKLLRSGGMSPQITAVLGNWLDERYGGSGAGNLLLSDATQIFKKYGAKRLPSVKTDLGGAVRSYQELQLAMKQYASETNSERAMEANMDSTDVVDYVKQMKAQATKELIDENGGRPPKNFDKRLYEKMAEKDIEMSAHIKDLTSPLPDAKTWAISHPDEFLVDTKSGLRMKPINGSWRSF
jgi:hypothetical protein